MITIQRIAVSTWLILICGLRVSAQDSDMKAEVRELRALVEKLQSRVAELESTGGREQRASWIVCGWLLAGPAQAGEPDHHRDPGEVVSSMTPRLHSRRPAAEVQQRLK
jgi:hypothetical protein